MNNDDVTTGSELINEISMLAMAIAVVSRCKNRSTIVMLIFIVGHAVILVHFGTFRGFMCDLIYLNR